MGNPGHWNPHSGNMGLGVGSRCRFHYGNACVCDQKSSCVSKRKKQETKKQIPQLEMVLFDLKNLAKDKGVKVE